MHAIDKYYNQISSFLSQIYNDERVNIEKAATLVANEVEKNKLVHVVGTGCHSRIGAEDVFFRAGGLASINAMLEFSMDVGALKTTQIERIPAVAIALLDYYRVKTDDVLILINAYGINGATIEMALECARRGVHLICVTSPENAKSIPEDHPARHPSRKNLCDLPMDVLIDCKMPVGDAVVKLEGLGSKVGPMTTIAISFIMQSLIVTAIEKLIEKGIVPPVITSFNAPDKGVNNNKIMEDNYYRIKNL